MTPDPSTSIAQITDRLVEQLAGLDFSPPVTHVYNPLVYARPLYDQYLARFAGGANEVVLLGMNPGPWGMAQTGVPFGEVGAVRDWMGLESPVARPANEHPKRPIWGLDCHRSEVSGKRLWGWARDTFGPPEAFFDRYFVLNYCPLMFLEASGRNRTPDKLRAAERRRLTEACDRALAEVFEVLEPRFVVGIGRFAERRAQVALDGHGELTIGGIAHPSPANPAANRGWRRLIESQLETLGVSIPGHKVTGG